MGERIDKIAEMIYNNYMMGRFHNIPVEWKEYKVEYPLLAERFIGEATSLSQAQLDADLEDLRKLKAKLEEPCPHNTRMSNTPYGNALCPVCWEAVWRKVLKWIN